MDREEGYNVSETGNWNVASDYSKIKIMKPLILADIYEDVAFFGYSDFMEELQNLNIQPEVLKINGMKRLIRILIRLIDNTLFAIKERKMDKKENKGDKLELKNYKQKLIKIEKLIPYLSEIQTNSIKKTHKVILKKEYYQVLAGIVEIKSLINEPLNRNHLIFTDKEEFDPREFKNRIKERMVNRG